MARAVDSDPDAWEWLYRRSHARLFAYARRRLGADVAAEEAVSETMTRALEKIDGFSWRGSGFDGWLYGILRNVVLEQYRAAERNRPAAETEPQPASPDHGPAAIVERRDESRSLRKAFSRLAPEDRELLELRIVGELSSEEVADVIGKKPGAVRMAQARALERLRGHLERTEHV